MSDILPVCAAVSARRDANLARELADKVIFVRKACTVRDLGNRKVGIGKQILCRADAHGNDVAHGACSNKRLKDAAQLRLAYLRVRGNLSNRKLTISVMLAYIGNGRLRPVVTVPVLAARGAYQGR